MSAARLAGVTSGLVLQWYPHLTLVAPFANSSSCSWGERHTPRSITASYPASSRSRMTEATLDRMRSSRRARPTWFCSSGVCLFMLSLYPFEFFPALGWDVILARFPPCDLPHGGMQQLRHPSFVVPELPAQSGEWLPVALFLRSPLENGTALGACHRMRRVYR